MLDTPRYQKHFVKNKEQIPGLLVMGSKKIREMLIKSYDYKRFDLISKVWENSELTASRAEAITVQVKKSFDSVDIDIDAMVEVLKLIEGSQIEAELETALLRAYVSFLKSDEALHQHLLENLSSDRLVVYHFGRKFLDWSKNLDEAHYPAVTAYRKASRLI